MTVSQAIISSLITGIHLKIPLFQINPLETNLVGGCIEFGKLLIYRKLLN